MTRQDVFKQRAHCTTCVWADICEDYKSIRFCEDYASNRVSNSVYPDVIGRYYDKCAHYADWQTYTDDDDIVTDNVMEGLTT